MAAKLGVATNANDILARFWNTGKYEKVDSSSSVDDSTPPSLEPAAGSSDGKQATDASGVKETLSPAMDILISSNFERLLWYLAYESLPETESARRSKAGAILAGWMGKMKSDGKVEVSISVLEAARRDFCAERVSDDEVNYHLLSRPFQPILTTRTSNLDSSNNPVTFPWNAILCR